MLAASPVAHFGAGMLGGTRAGGARRVGRTVAGRVDAFYVAFDLDALDAAGGWALTMPEPDGMSLGPPLRPSGDRRGGAGGRVRGDGNDDRPGRGPGPDR